MKMHTIYLFPKCSIYSFSKYFQRHYNYEDESQTFFAFWVSQNHYIYSLLLIPVIKFLAVLQKCSLAWRESSEQDNRKLASWSISVWRVVKHHHSAYGQIWLLASPEALQASQRSSGHHLIQPILTKNLRCANMAPIICELGGCFSPALSRVQPFRLHPPGGKPLQAYHSQKGACTHFSQNGSVAITSECNDNIWIPALKRF